jgi:peptidoglycan/LPS O-acetylase OafA/YrhL
MVVATREVWGKPGQAWAFLKRRLIRIVPLYWLMTSVKLAILVAGGHALLTSWHTISSFLFIPAWNDKREAYPVLVPGWTLFFEMFFYMAFACVLLVRKAPLWPLTLTLVPLALIGFVAAPFESALLRLLDLQLIEFVLGMWIGWLVLKGYRVSTAAAWGLLAVAVLAIALTNGYELAFTDRYRFFIWGIPSAVLLFAALSLEDARLWRSRVLQAVGDASYAIYLTHDFAVSAVRVLVQKLGLVGDVAVVVAIVLSLVVASIGGYMVHRLVEKPAMNWLRKRV